MENKVLLAISGGVDSSVAAKLLSEKGYTVIGATMTVCSKCDVSRDAKKICDTLGIKHYVFDLSEEFEKTVVSNFISEYERGLTPNPCVVCNKYIKFGTLLNAAKTLGCNTYATGHYARVCFENGKYLLKKAKDISKDQSYMLYNLTQETLSHTVFPLGELEKSYVRTVAKQSNFGNADKPDSQDICFIPDGDYARFIIEKTGKTFKKGNFIGADGKILGEHKGIIHYTVGQRRGLGLALPEPLYVVKKDVENNNVILGRNTDLFTQTFTVKDFNWISGEAPKTEISVLAKTRYRQTEQPAKASVNADNTVTVRFDVPQRAITPGQSAVLYDGDTVLGGGIIV